MGEGERYALPGDVDGPLLWTARPDALAITVGGKAVARLSDKPETVKDVPVSAAALLERNNPSGSQPATQSRTITRSAPPPPPAAAPLPSAPRAAPVLPQARPAPVAERPSAPASEAVSTVSEPDSTVSE